MVISNPKLVSRHSICVETSRKFQNGFGSTIQSLVSIRKINSLDISTFLYKFNNVLWYFDIASLLFDIKLFTMKAQKYTMSMRYVADIQAGMEVKVESRYYFPLLESLRTTKNPSQGEYVYAPQPRGSSITNVSLSKSVVSRLFHAHYWIFAKFRQV